MITNTAILKYITGYIDRKRYGIKTGELSSQVLLDTYSINSGCGYDEACSHLHECEDNITYKLCNFSVEAIIKQDIDYTKVKFSIPAFHNGIAPYTTVWTYDESLYSLVESTASYVILNRLVEAIFNTEISARVVDLTGCIAYTLLPISFEPIPFIPVMVCSGITHTGNFILGTASSGTITVPYSVQGYGMILIAVDDNTAGFSGSASPINVIPGNGSTTFPIQYNGLGDVGIMNVPIKLTYLNSASTCDAHIEIKPVPVISCSIPLNVTVEEDFDDSDSDSDSDSITECIPIAVVSGGTLPDAHEGIPYNHTIVLSGDLPFDLTITSKPAWMNISLVDSTIIFFGTPTEAAGDVLVDITVTNCDDETININQTIDIIPAIEITGLLNVDLHGASIVLDDSLPCDIDIFFTGKYDDGEAYIDFSSTITILAGELTGSDPDIADINIMYCINKNTEPDLLVESFNCSGNRYNVTLTIETPCP